MAASDLIASWLAANPQVNPPTDGEARSLSALAAGMDAAGITLLGAAPFDFRGSFTGATCNAPVLSRNVVLWGFALQADLDSMTAKTRRTIKKSILIRRANDAGKLSTIMAILDDPSNAYAKARWWAPDWPEVFFDDPEMLGLLNAAGADIATMTAPE